MSIDRRNFIKGALITGVASSCPLALTQRALANVLPKRVLILGGTLFLGPAIVDACLVEGHTITLFNRGVTNPDLFPHLEKVRGFRSDDVGDQNFSALKNRHFDVAIDVWPNDPVVVASAAEFLKDRVQHYLYVSSVGAYDSREFERAGIDENALLEPWNGPAKKYNRGKAESERRLHAISGEKLTIVRPGPIKGDRDTQPDLLTWLVRAQIGGKHIGPGNGSDPVEWVDAKDVARFLTLAINRSLFGTFNLTGNPMSFRDFLAACNQVTQSDAEFIWIPQDFLERHDLQTDFKLGLYAGNFPHWRPPGAKPGLYQISSEKAFRAGWQTRPFRETATDCLTYFRSLGDTLDWTDYLPADKEKQVIDAWQRRA
jgi:2'-hydroxyisoflavone reductase